MHALAAPIRHTSMYKSKVVLSKLQLASILKLLNAGNNSLLINHEIKTLTKGLDYPTKQFFLSQHFDWRLDADQLKPVTHALLELSGTFMPALKLYVGDYQPDKKQAAQSCGLLREAFGVLGIDTFKEDFDRAYMKAAS